MRADNIFLNNNRLIGDPEADQLVQNIFRNKLHSELYGVLKLSENEILKTKEVNPVVDFLCKKRNQPIWFDNKKLIDGQQVFKLYAAEIMALLGALALPYCYAASPGNKALYQSDKMRQSPGKRLLDTAHFVITVSTPGNLAHHQVGHVSINKTRLIHAVARYYVCKGDWNMAWGLPINQEDMAGTNLAFSVLILSGLQHSGFVLSDKQKEDFIHLWKYVGYHLAIEEDLLPSSFKEAYHLAQVIKKRNFKKSLEGVALTKELLSYYKSMATSGQAMFIDAQVRYFLGPEVAGYVGLEPDFLTDKVTNFLSSFKELQNLFSTHTSSYPAMVANHQLLKENLNNEHHHS